MVILSLAPAAGMSKVQRRRAKSSGETPESSRSSGRKYKIETALGRKEWKVQMARNSADAQRRRWSRQPKPTPEPTAQEPTRRLPLPSPLPLRPGARGCDPSRDKSALISSHLADPPQAQNNHTSVLHLALYGTHHASTSGSSYGSPPPMYMNSLNFCRSFFPFDRPIRRASRVHDAIVRSSSAYGAYLFDFVRVLFRSDRGRCRFGIGHANFLFPTATSVAFASRPSSSVGVGGGCSAPAGNVTYSNLNFGLSPSSASSSPGR